MTPPAFSGRNQWSQGVRSNGRFRCAAPCGADGAARRPCPKAEHHREGRVLAGAGIRAYRRWMSKVRLKRKAAEQFVWLPVLLAVFTAFAAQAQPSATNAAGPTNAAAVEPEPFMRIAHPDSNTVRLEIAVRRFVPTGHAGPAVWLTGTSHVGDADYYRALQKHLDAQTVVLFEGVNAESHPRKVPKPGAPPERPQPAATPEHGATNAGYSMQTELAKSLGLVFQLDAIAYDRTNFLNSDLSVFDIQKLMLNDPNAEPAAPGEEGRSDPTLDSLLQIMDGSSFLGSIFKWLVHFIGTNPELQATTKFMLVEMLGGMTGDFSEMRGLPPDLQHLLKVLIEARNQNVLEDLKTESAIVPANGSIAIFYGTGHMADLEKRLVGEMHYRPDGEQWFTAFSVDMRKTGMSPAEVTLMRNMIRVQLEQMK
jgi:hypothetical protein